MLPSFSLCIQSEDHSSETKRRNKKAERLEHVPPLALKKELTSIS